MWDYTGKKVKSIYLGREITGLVEATYVNYGIQVSHHIILDNDYDNGIVKRSAGEVIIACSTDTQIIK